MKSPVIIFTHLLVTALTFLTIPPIFANDDEALILSRDNQLFQLNPETIEEISRQPDEHGSKVIAFDAVNQTTWRYGLGILTVTALNGDELFSVEVPLDNNPIEQKLIQYEKRSNQQKNKLKMPYELFRKNSFLIVVPDKQRVFLALGNQLYLYDLQAKLITTVEMKTSVRGMVRDNTRQLIWIANKKHIFKVDDEGVKSPSAFNAIHTRIIDIAYDESLDQLWVAGNGLTRYTMDGKLQSRHRHYYLQRILSDHQGNLWGVNWFSLFRYAVDQDKATQQCKIKRNGRLLDMVVMPSNDGLWAANHSTITQYNSDCEKIQNERYPRNEKPIKALAFLSNDNNPIEIPVIQFISPKQGDIITQSRPTIMMSAQSGSYDINFNSLEVTVNGLSISSTCQNSQQQINCPLANDLPDGENILTTQINDVQGNVSVVTMATFVVEPEIIPDPIITIETPNNSTITNIKELTISGTLNILADVTLNHQASNYTNVFKLPLIDNNKFTTDVVLREGENTFAITATNTAGVSTSQTFKITLDSQSPVSPDVEKITAIIESENTVITGENNSVEAQMLVRIQNSRTSVITNVTANQNGAFLSNINAQLDDELIIVVSDLAGNESPSVTVTVKKPQDPNLPPDPEKEAPPIVKDGSTSVSDATIFIHQGENPIQTGVEPGTIEAKRTVLLRGKVTNTDGSVLSGVTISIHNHEEFGQTKSRADGMFDMVVNGGGYVTVQFNKTGYPPVQRKVLAPWQEYVVLPNVAMLPISTEVSTIDLTQPNVIQVAQNKAVTDKDGTRQGTVLFPPNTTATITLKDGTQKQLNQMNVHITEYTVGDKGVNAMPANLPANTDYTYAIELTTDEVLNEGIKVNGKDVEFNQPIPYYVENFLGFPVGTPVPSGYYDNDKNAWIASENGRVIEIVSIENGKANIDIDGDQQAEDNTTLSTFGINQNEQIKLAGLYQSGQTLWRVPLTHFSTYDFNYGRDCEGNCEPPEEEEPEKEKPEPDPECESGSIIQCENQVLGETIVVNKESWSLRYSSDRVSGRKTEHTLNIILSGNNVPKNVSKISLEIVIAGRKMYKEFDPLPNQKYSFVWDGKDVYGRTLSGAQSVLIRIGHQYKKGFYYLPPNVSKSFGYPSGQLKTSNVKARNPITVWQEYRSNLTFFRNSSFGGWNATMHHTIDVTSQLLLKGDGSKKSLNDYGFKIRKVAGRHGANGYLGNIKKATDAWLNSPTGVAIGGDGSLYIADYFNHRIRKVDTNGNISTIAGSGPIGIGKGGFGGDGGLAINANLFNPTDIDIGPNGGIYIADSRNERIRYVNSDGIISTVAGNGLGSRDAINGENGLAVDAMIYSTMIHVAFDGSLYFSASDSKRTVIRKVSVDGIITTIAGLGEDEENYGDGGLAINAIFTTISDITSDKDGNIYVAENTKIRKISINGIITTIAGSDESGAEGEGGLAINARFMKILTIDIGQDGTIYIIDNGGQIEKITPRIISIRPDGFVFMIAGMGKYSAEEIEGGSVRDVKLLNVGIFGGIAIGKMNDIYYSAGYVVNSIYYRNSENKYSKSSLSDIVIPSKLADELYVFNRYGRHLKTINAVTGSVIYEFYYNDQGLLIGVKDRDNQLTKITRSDNKITITSSKGQKTFLTLNSDGYLESVKNTENETIKLTYYNGGLLKSLKDAKLQIHYYSYDDQGRLKYDENPIGGSWSLTRKVLDDGYQVTKTSKLGRTTIFNIDNSQEKPGLINKIRTTTYPDGSKKEVIRSIISNDKKTINPDGTIIEEKLGYDPIFSVHAPFIKESILTTPNNLIQKTTREKSAKLLDKNDLSSLESLTNNVTINGR
ncbi:MAG: hypothetical protein HON94_07390, partial [Methylococcales bacterium]|nr:hypothetical protein [Methylococcales bacterium]